MPTKVDWDEPIPVEIAKKWENLTVRLLDVMSIDIARTYFVDSLNLMSRLELHIFSDASEKVICAVAYVVGYSSDSQRHVGFIMGKCKLAP